MATHRGVYDDLFDDDLDIPNPHSSSTRWRHQESTAYSRHAAGHHGGHSIAREAEGRTRTSDLADFLNSSRISPEEVRASTVSGPATPRYKPLMTPSTEAGSAHAGSPPATSATAGDTDPSDGREIAVGPLLNYRRIEGNRWVGSALVVTIAGGQEAPDFVPTLTLRRVGPDGGRRGAVETNGVADGSHTNGDGADGTGGEEPGSQEITGIRLYSDSRNTFWRFDLFCEIGTTETKWEYGFPGLRFASKTKPRHNIFSVPAITESMRIMFHSCNGFSVGTDEDAWSGPALWNDVLRKHREVPFHVMIGGGDQIYNDGIRVAGPLRAWTDIGNPKKRRDYPFPEELRAACDDYYLRNYIRWYGTEPFATANGQIPQLNIWDDHDIIDGFGSYVNDFMKCDVFRGIGGTAHKYYMLFQHHLPPPASTYTTDATFSGSSDDGQGTDPVQQGSTYVHPPLVEPNYIVGSKPGPYVAEHSHSMYTRLGARIAFLGIDARTERTRHQVNYPETYDQIFDRVRQEMAVSAGSGSPVRHLILLLGIPIAYPRLTWLENIFNSPLMGPVKFMNRRFGLGGGFFNHFDGNVDLLDDLDDHYTARTHKKERNQLIERLQAICADFSVRITILGGDVHLAALGRFYSNPHLNIPTENDYRYMANIISSAITNKPPPQAIANLLARRNKIHHLNADTDETLLNLFDRDPPGSTKTAGFNHVTMPSRNYAMITENSPNNPRRDTLAPAGQPATLAPPPANSDRNGTLAPPGSSAGASTRASTRSVFSSRSKSTGKNGHSALHPGEFDAGTKHKAASREHGNGDDGGLDVCICVEIDQKDHDGHTEGYGLTVPLLNYSAPAPVPTLPTKERSAGRRDEAETVG